MFIDTHAHIYTAEFDEDLAAMLDRTTNLDIQHIFMPNVDLDSYPLMMQLAADYSFCHPMVGLHPCHVFHDHEEVLSKLEGEMAHHSFAGVGEIGIDLYWDQTYRKEQIQAFRRQILLAQAHDLPFVIHSRDALDLTIDIVKELQDGTLRGIFHCFNGTIEQAERIMEIGFMMGIGGVITYKNAGVAEVVAQLPLEYLVLETDAPYLSPVPFRGKRNESSYISIIADKLSEIKNVKKDLIASFTTNNAKKVFRDTPF